MKSNLKIAFSIAFIFWLVALFTLKDYGINWDSPNHFNRGQAYLNYIFTGNTSYQNIPQNQRSIFQDNSESAEYYLRVDSAHPPLNGIMSAAFNWMFYQKLGIMEDIQSYHLFIITASAFLVYIVALFGLEAYGLWTGIFSALIMSTYPLFWAEGHFNIKDPVETAFFTATLYYFWKSTKHFQSKYLLLSVIFFAFALGTKFNILFTPFILLPWALIFFRKKLKHPIKFVKKIPRNYTYILLISPIIVLTIFFLSWPFLWKNTVINFLDAFGYYYKIGTGGQGQPKYILPGGFNLFPSIWIFFTTPPAFLFFTVLGSLAILVKIKSKTKTGLLWLFWITVTISRVSFPNTSIYGGARQIMEYIPAMALISGVGIQSLIFQIKKRFKINTLFTSSIFLLLFIPHINKLYKIHPNENTYFNCIIGSLRGAKKAKIPYAGNSFGNAYLQAVKWLNVNAPKDSNLALVQSVERSIPRTYLDSNKIHFSNSHWSAMDRRGEYLIELTHSNNRFAYPWVWEYVDNVLKPVYQVEVDSVPIAKIWKNDIQHSLPQFQSDEENLPIKNIKEIKDGAEIELKDAFYISRIIGECTTFTKARIFTSSNETNWHQEPENIGDEQVTKYPSYEDGKINYMFPARKAKYIRIYPLDGNTSCLFSSHINLLGFHNTL